MAQVLTGTDAVTPVWGSGFAALIDNPKIVFTTEGIEVALSGEVTLADGRKTTTVILREPTTRDLLAMDRANGDMAKAAALLSAIAGMTDSQVESIKARDFSLLSQVIGGFLSDGQ